MLTSLTIQRRRRWFGPGACLLAACLLISDRASAAPPNEAAGAKPGDNPWVIEIRPLQIGPEIRAAATGSEGTARVAAPDAPAAAASGLTPLMTYSQAYAAVPFNREEYEANPGYRHDAAMELMFGALRPTTIIKQNIPYFSRYPDFFRNRFMIYPYMNGAGGGQQSLNMYWLWSTNAITW
ncbi:MAG: hypothetical protein ACT4QC_23420 [Planctomycetaceae bacterium]